MVLVSRFSSILFSFTFSNYVTSQYDTTHVHTVTHTDMHTHICTHRVCPLISRRYFYVGYTHMHIIDVHTVLHGEIHVFLLWGEFCHIRLIDIQVPEWPVALLQLNFY